MGNFVQIREIDSRKGDFFYSGFRSAEERATGRMATLHWVILLTYSSSLRPIGR